MKWELTPISRCAVRAGKWAKMPIATRPRDLDHPVVPMVDSRPRSAAM
jgi:hypothetical protein